MMTQAEIVTAILNERLKQDVYKAAGKFMFTCADPEIGHMTACAVLMEEVGEAARAAMATLGFSKEPPERANLKKEPISGRGCGRRVAGAVVKIERPSDASPQRLSWLVIISWSMLCFSLGNLFQIWIRPW